MTKLNKILLWTSRVGVFLIPFIPLIISGSMFFPFITGKNFVFRIIVEIIFALWLLLVLREPRFRPKQSAILWSVAAFLGIVFVADIFGANPFKSFWSNFERMEGFITLIHLGAYFLVASSVMDSEKLWHRFFATSVGVSAFLGIYGILQLAGKIVINQGGVRLDGTFGNAAYFAGYMLFHIFLTLFLIFRHRIAPSFKWLKWFYGGAILLQIFTLIFTATRGAGIGLVIGLLVAFLLVVLLEKNNRNLRVGAISSLVVLIVLVAGLYYGRNLSFIKGNQALTRFASISKSDAGPRFMVWGMAWQGIKENPVFGWGQEGFNYVFNKYYDPDMWGQEQWFDRTHNILMDWLVASGILGLLAYLSLFLCILRYLWRGNGTQGVDPFSLAEKSALTGLLTAYFIHNFFVFDNVVSYILFFSFLSFIHARFGKSSRAEKWPVVERGQAEYIAGACVVVLLGACLYFLNARGIMSARDLITALRPQTASIAERLSFYKQASARETVGSQEVAEQAIQAAANVSASAEIDAGVKSEFVQFATATMEKEIARAPRDTRLHVFLGSFFGRLSQFDKAISHLETAHALSPEKQTISFELASLYLNTGKPSDALKLLKKAYENAPEFPNARIIYAAASIYAKQFSVAEELLGSFPDADAITDDRIVKAYYEVKAYDKVLALWKLRTEKHPADPQAHVSLAAAYLLVGNRSQSIVELQKAIELNPAFKEQAEFYIKEIRAGRNP